MSSHSVSHACNTPMSRQEGPFICVKVWDHSFAHGQVREQRMTLLAHLSVSALCVAHEDSPQMARLTVSLWLRV